VVARLGCGGFGDVYKALDAKIMSRPVVIKALKKGVLNEETETRDWLLT
jgi:serine/threonine protein kinase